MEGVLDPGESGGMAAAEFALDIGVDAVELVEDLEGLDHGKIGNDNKRQWWGWKMIIGIRLI